MDRKDTEKEIADSRAVTVARVRYTLAELLADAEASGAYPLPPEEREWVDAPAVGRELLVEDLESAEAIHTYLSHAEATGDVAYVEHAREIAGQAKIRYRIK